MPTRSARGRAGRLALAGLLALGAGPARAETEAVVAAVGQRPASAPVRVEPAEGGFRAVFPEAPHYEAKRETTLLGALHTRSWEVDHGTLRLRVERHDLPGLALRILAPESVLARAERGLLADLAARAVESEAAPWGRHPGRRLRYEPGDRPGEREEARIVLAGRRLYVVFARGAGKLAEEAQRFAASVEITGD